MVMLLPSGVDTKEASASAARFSSSTSNKLNFKGSSKGTNKQQQQQQQIQQNGAQGGNLQPRASGKNRMAGGPKGNSAASFGMHINSIKL
jgi:hypothetical protein